MSRIAYLPLAIFAGILLSAGCRKDGSVAGCLTLKGRLQQQGPTTHQYGTHVLTTDKGNEYVLKSKTISLQRFVGKKVTIVAKTLHYKTEHGPELYNVMYITRL